MIGSAVLVAAALALPVALGAQSPPIAVNDNRVPAGRVAGGTLSLELTVGKGNWFPEAADGGYLEVLAFAERGRALSIPGPLIRVPAGTKMRIRVSNPLERDVSVVGLSDRPVPAARPEVIPARGERLFEFTATTPGTYSYGGFVGTNDGADFAEGSQLTGAFIIDDPAKRRDDRVFVIGVRFQEKDSSAAGVTPEQVTMVINGKSWPYTERLEMTQGDSIFWRIVNASVDPHPMHLHGFYFRVDSRGSWQADTIFGPEEQRLAVTELMYPGSTYTMAFVPLNPGNWVYHCHFAFHVGPEVALKQPEAQGNGHSAHSGERHMSGLVLAMHVQPSGPPPLPAATRREVNLYLQSKPGHFRDKPGFAFVEQNGETPPAPDSLPAVFEPLVLRRDEPVRINVINRMEEPTAVHWHGIELESFPDGVPHFSGMPGNLFTHVPAGGTFAAEFTPPRSGTFIYHSHLNEMDQIMSGLFGALIVVDPDKPFDPEHDKVILVGGAGPPPANFEDPQAGTINGSREPRSMTLRVGETYRFRLININPDWRVEFLLGSDTTIATWRPIAKDGADLPENQRGLRSAYLLTGPGETADFEFTPQRADFLRLRVRTRDRGWHNYVSIRVVERPER
jgi:manganese oxidase